jgi:hypothetical protein
VRHSIEYELSTLERSFPRLRRIRRETLTTREADSLADEVFGWANRMSEKVKEAGALEKGMAAIIRAMMYPQARKALQEWGQSSKELDSMPKSQVVLLWYAGQWDRAGDDILKALTVPIWQGFPLMEAALKEHRSAENALLTLLLPALHKTWLASVRIDRQLASLRCAEALRWYATKHEGKPPRKWSDITEVPLPIDPFTGKGFDDFYQLIEGPGILEISLSALPGMPASLRRRYELEPPR